MFLNNQFPTEEHRRDNYLISTDANLLNIDVIHDYLANQSYWAQGVAIDIVARSLRFSLCFGVYKVEKNHFHTQVGLARVISDFATFAYLSDVFILPAHQGQGLGKWLVDSILVHPAFETLRKFTLDTKDAHELYKKFGFIIDPIPNTHMVFRPK